MAANVLRPTAPCLLSGSSSKPTSSRHRLQTLDVLYHYSTCPPRQVRIHSSSEADGDGPSTSQQQQPLEPAPLPGDLGWNPLRLSVEQPAMMRLRETEVIHARWAMLGVLALLAADLGGTPLLPAPPSSPQLLPGLAFLGAVIGLLETYRMAALWGERDLEARLYPGRAFDPLGLASERALGQEPIAGAAVLSPWIGGWAGWLAGGWQRGPRAPTAAELSSLKAKELRNGRLAMLSFAGCAAASLATGQGPFALLAAHLHDPLANNVLQLPRNMWH